MLIYQTMPSLDKKIESILLFKNEPVSISFLTKTLGATTGEIKEALGALESFYKERGIVLVTDGESVALGTNGEHSELIEKIQKEELSRDLGRAGLETLAIILYRGAVSRREIDYIRGVNSSFILRALMIRGLIERTESETGERSYSYKPTLELLRHLGVTKREDLPNYDEALAKMLEFVKRAEEEEIENNGK